MKRPFRRGNQKKGLGEWWPGRGYDEGGQDLIACVQGGLSVIGCRRQEPESYSRRVSNAVLNKKAERDESANVCWMVSCMRERRRERK